MSVRVTDILRDPLGDPSPNTQLRVTTTEGVDSLTSSTQTYTTLSDGSYDFDIVFGIHTLEILWDDTWECIGKVIVNDGTPNPTTLEDLIAYSPLVPPPPIQSEDPIWEDLYGDVCCSPDSCESCKCSQVVQGDASNTDIQAAYCNERLGASLGEHQNYSVTSDSECVSEQHKSYSDECGSLSADYRRALEVDGGCVSKLEQMTRDGNCNFRIESNDECTTPNTLSQCCSIQFDRCDCCSVAHAEDNCTVDAREISLNEVNDDELGGSLKNGGRFVGTVYETSIDNIQRGHVYDFAVVNEPLKCHERVYTDCDTNTVVSGVSECIRRIDDSTVDYCHSNSVIIDNKEMCTTCTHTGLVSCEHKVVDCLQLGDIACFDQVNNRVTFAANVVFNPSDSSCICATPDRIYDCYEYSPFCTGPWNGVLETGDIWRRTSCIIECGVDGCTYQGPYSVGRLAGNDGDSGDTIFFEFQYSVCCTGPWNDFLVDGDEWRRERTNCNGDVTAWSTPACIVGSDGDDGTGVAVEYYYAPTSLPPDDPGWHPNFLLGDYWRRERVFTLLGTGCCVLPAFHEAIYKLNPEKDVDYTDGSAGAGFYKICTSECSWPNDVCACALFCCAAGRDPFEGDVLSLINEVINPHYAESRIYDVTGDPSPWVDAGTIFNGSVIVNGTIAAEKITVGSLSGVELNAGATIIAASSVETTAGLNGCDAEFRYDPITCTACVPNCYCGYRFWAGAEYPKDAPFRIDNNACMLLGDARFSRGIRVGNEGNDYYCIFAQNGGSSGEVHRMVTNNRCRYRQYGDGRTIWYDASGNIAVDFRPATGEFTFRGTIFADEIVGDLVSATLVTLNQNEVCSGCWATVGSFCATNNNTQVASLSIPAFTTCLFGCARGSGEETARNSYNGAVRVIINGTERSRACVANCITASVATCCSVQTFNSPSYACSLNSAQTVCVCWQVCTTADVTNGSGYSRIRVLANAAVPQLFRDGNAFS